MQERFEQLKKKWNIQSNWDFFLINVVFALAGMAVVFVRKPAFALFGFTISTPLWLKTIVYILIVFPTYQLNLLLFGFVFGQFAFFWDKQKQIARFLIRRLSG